MKFRERKLPKRKLRSPRIESLEPRQMLTAGLNATLDRGVLRIVGTEGNDTIQVGTNGQSIQVRGVARSFNSSEVRSIDIRALGGNDVVSLTGFDNFSQAIAIPATIHGGAGNDEIHGGSGADEILGGAGNDTINGNLGNDKIYGDNGTRTGLTNLAKDFEREASRAADVAKGALSEVMDRIGTAPGRGNGLQLKSHFTRQDRPEVVGRAVFQALHDSSGDLVDASERHQNGGGNDRLFGGAGDDQIWGEGGNDRIEGGDGDDRLRGGKGDDAIQGGNGDDHLWGDEGTQREKGQGGRPSVDKLWEENQRPFDRFLNEGRFRERDLEKFANELIADLWTDLERLIVGGGQDVLVGGEGDDEIWGEQNHDRLSGENGDDHIMGGSGNDVISGGNGEDKLWGEGGADEMHGGDNNAFIRVVIPQQKGRGRVEFVLKESAKNIDGLTARQIRNLVLQSDRAKAESLTNESDFQIHVDVRGDVLRGGPSNDIILGDSGDDEIFGEGGNDTISGGSGEDVLRGGKGDDFIRGGDGDDEIYGGEGDDYLRGGDGQDVIFGNRGTDVLDGGNGKDFLAGGVDYEIDILYNKKGDFVEDEKGVDKYTKDPDKLEKIAGEVTKVLSEYIAKELSEVPDELKDAWMVKLEEGLDVFKRAKFGMSIFKLVSGKTQGFDTFKAITEVVLHTIKEIAEITGNVAMKKSLLALNPKVALALAAIKIIVMFTDEGPRKNALNAIRDQVSDAGDKAINRVHTRMTDAYFSTFESRFA